jgi:hypothetical protein
LKKQMTKKLSIQRETLTTLALERVAGGVTDFCGTSQINDTVYHPQPAPLTNTVGNA